MRRPKNIVPEVSEDSKTTEKKPHVDVPVTPELKSKIESRALALDLTTAAFARFVFNQYVGGGILSKDLDAAIEAREDRELRRVLDFAFYRLNQLGPGPFPPASNASLASQAEWAVEAAIRRDACAALRELIRLVGQLVETRRALAAGHPSTNDHAKKGEGPS